MTFDEAIKFILKEEGGYIDHPNDPGGETNFGISKRAFPKEEIKNLTLDRAKFLYFENYWKPAKCDIMPDNVVLMHFDTAVNMGVGMAIKLLQKTIGVVEDGVIGEVTKQKILRGVNLYWYALLRMQKYMLIVKDKPSSSVFLQGWSNRVLKVMTYRKE